jgi:hypothetical protein
MRVGLVNLAALLPPSAPLRLSVQATAALPSSISTTFCHFRIHDSTMRWAQEAAGVIFTTFRLLFDREDTCYLSRLPADVLIDNIFPLLLVEDIIRLRQVHTYPLALGTLH